MFQSLWWHLTVFFSPIIYSVQWVLLIRSRITINFNKSFIDKTNFHGRRPIVSSFIFTATKISHVKINTYKVFFQAINNVDIAPKSFMILLTFKKMYLHYNLINILKISHRETSKSWKLSCFNVYLQSYVFFGEITKNKHIFERVKLIIFVVSTIFW